jgi:proline dehydrogenase
MSLLRPLLLRASRSDWLGRRLPRFGFARRAVRRFMPGEDLDAALDAAKAFRPDGIATVLTVLGENVTSAQETAGVVQQFQETLQRGADAGLDLDVSVKPTHLGFDLSPDLARDNIRALAETAAKLDRVVWVDMESSAYTDGTLELYRMLRPDHANLGVCLQANLRRTPQDLESLAPLWPCIRLVKGAYLEPPDRAYARKADVDVAYQRLVDRLVQLASVAHPGDDARSDAGVERIAFATHDLAMIAYARAAAGGAGLEPGRYDLQMLYGIRPDTQRRLAHEGERVRVLISFGSAWYPWYMRRLAERPANVVFLLRSVFAR